VNIDLAYLEVTKTMLYGKQNRKERKKMRIAGVSFFGLSSSYDCVYGTKHATL
jgi:hypothetical protein